MLCSIVAGLCTWAAIVLPWRDWTTIAIVTSIVGLTHAATAVLALVGSPLRAAAWRLQAIVALTYLGTALRHRSRADARRALGSALRAVTRRAPWEPPPHEGAAPDWLVVPS